VPSPWSFHLKPGSDCIHHREHTPASWDGSRVPVFEIIAASDLGGREEGKPV
jgi:hypothetical protein